jgi:ABC-type sugar transport system ATPase subunit
MTSYSAPAQAQQPLLRLRGVSKTFGPTLAGMRVTTVRSIRQPVGSLSGGQRQAIAVAKAVMHDAKLVIMDGPTAALGVSQTALVLAIIRQLASQGIAVPVISHNLTDVFRVADRLAVLYLGSLVSTGPAANYDTSTVVHLMTTGTGPAAAPAGPPGRHRAGIAPEELS